MLTHTVLKWTRIGLFGVIVMAVTVLGLRGAMWPAAALAGPTIPLVCPTYHSTDVPKAIPDNSTTGITSTLAVAGPGLRITNISVRLNSIVHTFVGDLRVRLTTPNQATATLIGNPGIFANDGDNFYGTTLDDKFPTLIMDGIAPFTGGYRPVQLLAGLRGQLLAGTYQLHVADVEFRDEGTLESWSLEICALPEALWLPVIKR